MRARQESMTIDLPLGTPGDGEESCDDDGG
jgi:hypothetical protein